MAVPVNVQNAIDNGYEFRFGDYIGQGFQLVQKNLGIFIAGTLILLIIMLVGVKVFPMLLADIFGSGGYQTFMIKNLATQVIFTPILTPLMFGFYIAAHQAAKNKDVEISHFFAGTQKFVPLALVGMLTGILTLVASAPGYYLVFSSGLDLDLMSNQPTFFADSSSLEDLDLSGILLGYLVLFIPSAYITVSYLWAPLLVWFCDMRGWEAMEASRKLAGKNFLFLFGFLIVVMLIGFAGLILLCIGVLFTFPVAMSSLYHSFADAVGLNRTDEDGLNEVIDHFAPKM